MSGKAWVDFELVFFTQNPTEASCSCFLGILFCTEDGSMCSYETSVDLCWTAWCHISEDSSLRYKSCVTIMRRRFCESLKEIQFVFWPWIVMPAGIQAMSSDCPVKLRMIMKQCWWVEMINTEMQFIYSLNIFILYMSAAHIKTTRTAAIIIFYHCFLSALGEYQHVLFLCQFILYHQTVAAHIQYLVKSCGICGGQSATG
jgi:hypothetical protein